MAIQTVALIKAHAQNELVHFPKSVTAQDRLFLVGEIERLTARQTEDMQLLDALDRWAKHHKLSWQITTQGPESNAGVTAAIGYVGKPQPVRSAIRAFLDMNGG